MLPPQFISFYMNKTLGDKPLVTTRELREDGEYEFDSKDYTDLALLFLIKSFAVTRAVNSEEFANIGWLIRWCLNDPTFKNLVKDTIVQHLFCKSKSSGLSVGLKSLAVQVQVDTPGLPVVADFHQHCSH